MNWISAAAIIGALGIALGAFGAHGLKRIVEPELLAIWETAVRYHVYHVFALIAVGLIQRQSAATSLNVAGWLFAAGIAIFSGSLYVLTLTGQRWLGAITPIGGVAFIAGWVTLAVSTWNR